MPRLHLFALCSFALCLTLFVAACSKEPVVRDRDKFLGAWDGDQSCVTLAIDSVFINITKQSGTDENIVIGGHDFYGFGYNPTAIADGSRFIIPAQKHFITNVPELSYEFSGEAILNNGVLTINYNVNRFEEDAFGINITSIDACTIVCAKIVN